MEVNVYPLEESFGGDFMEFCIKESKAQLPSWYKESNSYTIDAKTPFEKDKHMTMKKCMPILDYLSLGLNLYTPSTIYAEGIYPNRNVFSASHDPAIQISGHHADQKQNMPIPEGYEPSPLKIEFPYLIETPKGYSSLFIGYNEEKDFPFLFPSALVETDKYKAPTNFPFFIRKDFQGKIDAGTLFMKVIFVKRVDIVLNYKKAKDIEGKILQHRKMVQAFGSGFYKKLRLNKI